KSRSERRATASLRTAPQPGFLEDPKRMRPLSTQRPERPKSELWHKKYEKCGLSKARDAACLCTGDRRYPCDGRKKRGTSTCGGIPDNSFRRGSRIRSLHRFVARTGRCLFDRAVPTGPGAVVVEKARKFHALFGVMIDYKPQCQQGGNHEHANRFTQFVGRRAEADYPAARSVLFAYPWPLVVGRTPHGGWNAAGPWDHEGDAHGGEGLCRHHRCLRRG